MKQVKNILLGLILFAGGLGVGGCGDTTCLPRELLFIKVIDGTSGEKMADASVRVNGHIIEDGKMGSKCPKCNYLRSRRVLDSGIVNGGAQFDNSLV